MFRVLLVVCTLLLLVTSVRGECCPIQVFCSTEDDSTHSSHCFNCDQINHLNVIFGKRHWCGIDSCNVFSCGCTACIKYDPSLWCVLEQPHKNLVCTITDKYADYIKDFQNWADFRLRPKRATKSRNTDFVKELVLLVRPKFTKQPLSKIEFQKLLVKFLEVYFPAQDVQKIDVEKEFTAMDLNRNGKIELAEIEPNTGL